MCAMVATVGLPGRLDTALVVEDDRPLVEMLRRHLVRGGFVVYDASTEHDARQRLQETIPDVVVLDLGLTEGSGSRVCEWLREQPVLGDIPVLVLSARDNIESKVALLALGADDYVVKPCDPTELIARLHGLLRRRNARREVVRFGSMRVAIETGDVWVGERYIELTAGERLMLSHLARNWPALTSRELLDHARWRGDAVPASNVTEVLIARLRRKLREAGAGVEIRAVRRLGYVLRPIEVTEEVEP